LTEDFGEARLFYCSSREGSQYLGRNVDILSGICSKGVKPERTPAGDVKSGQMRMRSLEHGKEDYGDISDLKYGQERVSRT
jgi:hypothetical protein